MLITGNCVKHINTYEVCISGAVWYKLIEPIRQIHKQVSARGFPFSVINGACNKFSLNSLSCLKLYFLFPLGAVLVPNFGVQYLCGLVTVPPFSRSSALVPLDSWV